MTIEPISTELVCQVDAKEDSQILQEHFKLVYSTFAESKIIPNAAYEEVNGGITRCLSGCELAYMNAVINLPIGVNWDTCIEEQLKFFKDAQMPFVWFLDENSSTEFKQKLLDYGFQDGGIFRGVIGNLDRPVTIPEIPNDCELQLVKDEVALDEFNDVVCSVFGMEGACKESFKQLLREGANRSENSICHWVARKQGKVVSAVSTLIENEMVSFWNGASLPEIRRQGLSTALRRFALNDAISKGCRMGSSYLMSEGLAFGICSKLGYQTKWRFNVFLSPTISK